MKKTKNMILTLIQIILVSIIVYSLYNIGTYYYENYKSTKKLNQISEEVLDIEKQVLNDFDNKNVDSESKKEIRIEKPKTKKQLNEISKKVVTKLKENNGDIVAFIKLDGFKINYPVVYKREDNDYYLFKDLDENWSRPGTIFVNGWSEPDFSDMNTTIFGHNLRTNPEMYAPMFKLLLEFEKKEVVNSKKEHFIEIYTEQGYKKYKIFSSYFSDANNDYIESNRDRGIWVDYLNELRNKSTQDFSDSYKFNEDTKIVTLSTCDNDTDIGRYVVHAYELLD